MAPFTWILAGILTGAIICGFGWFMPARTVAGVRTLEKVLGFEDFLSRVEKDQIARLEKTPELFEKYLPYAMALGVEKKWAQAFSGIAMQPPSWYQGNYYGAGFQPYFLVNRPQHDVHASRKRDGLQRRAVLQAALVSEAAVDPAAVSAAVAAADSSILRFDVVGMDVDRKWLRTE